MTQKTIFKISGMNCSSCAKVIKYGLQEETGIKNVDVDFNSAEAKLEFNPAETDVSKIKDKIKDLGYEAIEE